MTKEEILKLHELSEEEQYKWLIDNKVLVYVEPFQKLWESLADCAFRLRDEMGDWNKWYEAWNNFNGEFSYIDCEDAKPINWIQAALLARAE